MVLSTHTSSTIGSLTHRQFIRWKKVQQVMKGKEDRQNFQGESKVENRLRIKRRGIEKRSRILKEERNWIGKRKINYRL